MSQNSLTYVNVLLPLRLTVDISYSVPAELCGQIKKGSYVKVHFANKEYIGTVTKLLTEEPGYKGPLKEILSLSDTPPVTEKEFRFWEWISEYYMCTPGEVFKSAAHGTTPPKSGKSGKKGEETAESNIPLEPLSNVQEEVFKQISESIISGKPALLKGVTGSGKTEIYLHLAKETIEKGRDVLFMVPEIALSRQLTSRIAAGFREKLLVYHSGQTPAKKKEIARHIKSEKGAVIVLGLRSSVFLPFTNLGLIIIDEEHDSSYKQNDPAPRYNGRDSAIMLAKIHNAGVVMGSATPSLESLYNCIKGRYTLVELNQKYYPGETTSAEIVDTIREQKRGMLNGLFTCGAIEAIRKRLSANEQVMVFRNRRSYSPMVQCIYCGDIPGCIHCNVAMSYHKSAGNLMCHYCGHKVRFSVICTKCGNPGLKERGCGTEMIEEQVRELFPEAKVVRFDAETASSKIRAKKILTDFAKGNTDIMIGTQMVSKGFDFEKLSLIVLVQADSMFSTDDFRSGERAMQLLVQLAGRSGRRNRRGHILIQTAQPNHRIYSEFVNNDDFVTKEMTERKEFEYPPFTRILNIVFKHNNKDKLLSFAALVKTMLPEWGVVNFNGPFAPLIERVMGYNIVMFRVRLSKKAENSAIKSTIFAGINSLTKKEGKGIKVHFDVDPL